VSTLSIVPLGIFGVFVGFTLCATIVSAGNDINGI
jgi:hypothetical protein